MIRLEFKIIHVHVHAQAVVTERPMYSPPDGDHRLSLKQSSVDDT